MKENVDYELIPSDNESWNVRIISGEFVETEYYYGPLTVAEDGEHLTYSAILVSSPHDNISDENLDWHKVTGDILSDIMERAITSDELRADDTTKHSNE